VSNTSRAVLFTIGYVAAGLIAVVAVGGLTYGRQLLNFPEPLLTLLLLGLMGGLIYASVQMDVPGFVVPVVALAFVARVALTPRSYSHLATAIYTLVMGVALLAAAYAQKSLALKFGRFLSTGLVVAAGYALMTLLFISIWNTHTGLGTVWRQAFLGAKFGIGLGLGFELIDLIGPRPEHLFFPAPSALDNRSEDT